MNDEIIRQDIISGRTSLGIEFGSTRIKAVLISSEHEVIATGSFNWENILENGLWVYHLEDALKGLRYCYGILAGEVRKKYSVELETIGSIGISGMMHGIIALDAYDRQLTPFLTWRNTNTERASEILTRLFGFNIPLRWTVSQLYQAVLENREYVRKINYVTTLSGYIHYLLCGKKNIGIGEASGMFPIDSGKLDYDQGMIDKFDGLVAEQKYPWKMRDVFPKVLVAGEKAGVLTLKGATLLDESGKLKSGIPMVPPEGDAGTGMTATDSVAPRTGNVSAGTSIFSMVVLDRPLSRLYKDIDMVTTPTGRPVAMVHCNNGTSELDQWFNLFKELCEKIGKPVKNSELYDLMFFESLNGDSDCSDIIYFNYLSGEPVCGLVSGLPLLVRKAESRFNFANFMRSQLYSVFAALSIGNEILIKEKVQIDRLTGHGGMFKTKDVAQRFLSAAMKAPVTVMETAGEGGPYGMAILASYYLYKDEYYTLEEYLTRSVFKNRRGNTMMSTKEEITGFERYMDNYRKLLVTEKSATENLK